MSAVLVGLVHHRHVTADDTVSVDGSDIVNFGAPTEGGRKSGLNRALELFASQNVNFRFFGKIAGGTASGETFDITIVAVSLPCPGQGATPPKGVRLLTATVTLGTDSTPNKHPITGLADAGETWYEAKLISVTSGSGDDAGTNYKLYRSDAGLNLQAEVSVDTLQNSRVLCLVHNRSTSTLQVDVSARHVPSDT